MALSQQRISQMSLEGRNVEVAKTGDEDLGPLSLLPGIWKNTDALHGYGFNMIALPMNDAKNGYRLLMNQYDEELHFSIVDKGVPNRGSGFDGQNGQTDQFVVALDYDQKITQIAAADSPPTGLTDKFDGQVIHREPGLWLHMTNRNTDGFNIARLGTVPHGDSLLAVGIAPEKPFDGLPPRGVPQVNGLVIGGGDDLTKPYFEPYKHFVDSPFKGAINIEGFDGFEPLNTTKLLDHAIKTALPGVVKRSTVLHIDSTRDHAGIRNIPFVVRQANATAMNATFTIMEVEDTESGRTRLFLQYVQNVILDFIGRPDGHPGLARWPHISINTMEKVSEAKPESAKMEMLSK